MAVSSHRTEVPLDTLSATTSGSTARPAQTQTREIDKLKAGVEILIRHAMENLKLIEGLRLRTTGSWPQEVEKDRADRPQPDGSLAELNAALLRADVVLAAQETHLRHLSEAL